MDVEIVKISSRGQFVLPLSMRKKRHIATGDKMMLIDTDGTIVVRPLKNMGADVEDEMYMMQRAALGWEQIEAGKSKKMNKEGFLKELSKW